MSPEQKDCIDNISIEIQNLNLPFDLIQDLLKGGINFIDEYSAFLTKKFNELESLDKINREMSGLRDLISHHHDLGLKKDLYYALAKTREAFVDVQKRINIINPELNKIGKAGKVVGPAGKALDIINISTKVVSGDGSGAIIDTGKVIGGTIVGLGATAVVTSAIGALGLTAAPLGLAVAALGLGLGFAGGDWLGGKGVEWVMKLDSVKPFIDQAGDFINDWVNFAKQKINDDTDSSTNSTNNPAPSNKEEKNKPNNQSNNPDKKPHCPWKDGLDPHRTPDTQVHDPLVLDLDGDGIETIAANGLSGSLFDHNNNGIRIATGWVGKDDGILVRDINGNGQIDNALELMSDKVRAATTSCALTVQLQPMRYSAARAMP